MPINKNLNVAPYYDDFDVTKKYYRILFKPGYALQARELTQLQTTLQNQIEQFGDNVFKEGSIVKGCTFTELRNLSYVKVVDGITATLYTDRTEVVDESTTIEYYYEIENASGLKAYIVQAANGFISKAPDTNTFFINYLNTVEATQQKVFAPGETLSIKEYRLVREVTVDPFTQEESASETLEGGDTVATTTVVNFSDPVGSSFGLNVSEGIIFQRGHFLYSDEQTIVLTKYMPSTLPEGSFNQPHNIAVGFVVDEEIINSQLDTSLLDNANGSENENAPGADRLKLSPVLVSLDTVTADADPSFFILRRYVNGNATQIRDVSQYNIIGEEFARRTYEESGDYVVGKFDFETVRKNGTVNVKVGPGVAYAKGYRVQNASEIFLPIDDVSGYRTQTSQPISFEYGGYVDVANSDIGTGIVDLSDFENINLLASDGTTVLGSAIVKNYTTEATNISTTQINQTTNSRLYLFGVRMKDANTNFSSVAFAQKSTGTGVGTLKINPVIRQPDQSKLVFDLGQDYIKGLSNINLHTRKSATISLSANSSAAAITPASGETFTTDSLNHILVVGQSNTRLVVSNTAISSGGNLTFNVNQVGGNLTAFYDVRVTPTLPRAKQTFDVYVKTTFLSSGGLAKTKYTLGLPDVYKLISVTNGTTDYTSSFKLVPNQKDDFYDHSYIELIAGRPAPADNTVLTVKVSVFKPDSSGVYNIFTVNSYSSIDPADIPYFNGKSGTYNLRDCIDLRPHRLPLSGVTYATTVGSAPSIPTSEFVGLPTYTTALFSTSDTYLLPSLATNNTTDVEYYLNRTDTIAVDSYGEFYVLKGDEATKSRAPLTTDKTPIAEVYVPGYPTYTLEEARSRGKVGYGVKVTSVGTPNYTMKDIKRIDDQIERLSYYVTLSALEAETTNLLIRDENGLDRFKNGIIVDPFNDLSIADLNNPNFNASIDFTERSLAPAVQTFPLNLKPVSATGVETFNGALSTMQSSNNSVVVIAQHSATNYRTTTSNFYFYRGQGALTPEYDGAYDTTTNPQNISLDITGPFDSLVDSIQEFYPLTTTSSAVVGTSRTTTRTDNSIITDTRRTIRDTVREIQSTTNANEVVVGDFVTDVRFNPYIRSREVKIEMYGLRPNTRHYFFFGGVDVNDNVAPAILRTGASATDTRFGDIGRSGVYGAPVYTNASGELYAVFNIPAETFFVGDTKLEVVDVDAYDDISSASLSRGSLTYRAYNFSIDKTRLTISTRIPDYSISQTVTDRTVTNRSVVPIRTDEDRDNKDPLAQTFFIKSSMSTAANAIYLSKVDLFFKRKSPVNGVTLMIREVLNGYPSSQTVPFSKVHLPSAQVSVSEDSSVATTFAFNTPVRLEAEKEYAIVVMPDGNDPDYLVFTSKVGGKDLITGLSVTQDAFDGTLFTSTNNRAWISYQDEDLKFVIYRHAFNTGSGQITLELDDVEFLTLSNWVNVFNKGELVYSLVANTVSAAFIQGTETVTGTSIGSSFQVGDYMYVVNGTGTKDLLRVTAVAGDNNSVTVDEAAKFSGTFTAQAAVGGRVNYYNPSNPQYLYLEGSSARDGRKFTANSSIVGIQSGATATIGTIDNIELSFIQPSIERITDNTNQLTISASVVDPNLPLDTPYSKTMVFNDRTLFNEKGCLITSKSNETVTTKNFEIDINMSCAAEESSPVVDVENAMIFANRYYINNASGDDALATYISKTVTLAEGFDAEDFRLYVTGYRPTDSDIEAYIRVLNAADSLTIESNPWIPLDMVQGIGVFSSSTNTNDFREFVYDVSSVAGANYGKENGVVYYTNSTGKYSGYKSFQIRLVLKSSTIGSVPRLLDYRGVALT